MRHRLSESNITMKMKVFKIEIMVLDFDGVGADEVKYLIENIRYPNRAISPKVKNIESREVVWSDDHPLNRADTEEAAYRDLFR